MSWLSFASQIDRHSTRQHTDEPSHAREWRWPADFEINVNSRHPVMRVVVQQRLTMDAKRFATGLKNEMEAMLQGYLDPSQQTAVGQHLRDADLSASQAGHIAKALRQALVDTNYTILLHLDGSAAIDGLQHCFKLIDENGNQVYEPGDLEAEAWEAFQSDT